MPMPTILGENILARISPAAALQMQEAIRPSGLWDWRVSCRIPGSPGLYETSWLAGRQVNFRLLSSTAEQYVSADESGNAFR